MPNLKRVPTPYSYSSAVQAGDFVFLGLHRGFGESFAVQCEGAVQGVRETLEKLGLTLDQLVKVNVWLKNVKNLPEMEKIFHKYFPSGQFPARMTATTEFIDEDCLMMIEGTAYSG